MVSDARSAGCSGHLTYPGVELVAPVLFPGFVRDVGNRVARAVAGLGWRAPRVEEMWSAYSSLTDPGHRETFMRTLRAVIDPGGQAVSAENRLYLTAAMPTLVVWGDADPIIPVAHAHTAHAAMPASRLEILPGVGHFPHAEEPELLRRDRPRLRPHHRRRHRSHHRTRPRPPRRRVALIRRRAATRVHLSGPEPRQPCPSGFSDDIPVGAGST